MLPQGRHTEAVVLRQPRLSAFVLAAELGDVRATQVVLALKAGRGRGEQLRLGTV